MEIRSTKISKDSALQSGDIQAASSSFGKMTRIKADTIRVKWVKTQHVTMERGSLELSYVEMDTIHFQGVISIHGNGRKGPRLRFEDCSLWNVELHDVRREGTYSFIRNIHWWNHIP